MTTDEPKPAYLVDTHAFLWMVSDPGRLGTDARSCIDDPGCRLFLSVASAWEMAIKASLGKLSLPGPVALFLEEQLTLTRTRILPVEAEHAVRVEGLPFHHRDPFDRLLVAQAAFEKMPLLSADAAFDAYEIDRIW